MLIKQFTNVTSNNIVISKNIKKFKVHNELWDVGNFISNNKWIQSFKKRHVFSFKKISAKSAAVDKNEINSWTISIFNFLFNYKPTDIYNLDKTGYFCVCLQPHKALCFRIEKISDRKGKDKLTILLDSNMAETDKLNPVVIGRSQRPRCFKNKEKTMKTLVKKLVTKERRCLQYLDLYRSN